MRMRKQLGLAVAVDIICLQCTVRKGSGTARSDPYRHFAGHRNFAGHRTLDHIPVAVRRPPTLNGTLTLRF